MNTTFIPINTAQMSNALTDMGTWLGAYFPAFLGLAMFIAALIIVPLVLRGILNWIIDGVRSITKPKEPIPWSNEWHEKYSDIDDK